jgi:hypothetical protein
VWKPSKTQLNIYSIEWVVSYCQQLHVSALRWPFVNFFTHIDIISSQNIGLLSWITLYVSLWIQCHLTKNILSSMSSWWLRLVMQAYWSSALLCWWVGRYPFSYLNIDSIASFLPFNSAARIMWFECDTNSMTFVTVKAYFFHSEKTSALKDSTDHLHMIQLLFVTVK